MCEWWFENDGYGIVGWSFVCSNCGEINRFAFSPEIEMDCEYCDNIVKFKKEEIETIKSVLY